MSRRLGSPTRSDPSRGSGPVRPVRSTVLQARRGTKCGSTGRRGSDGRPAGGRHGIQLWWSYKMLRHDLGMPGPELDINFYPAQARLMTRMGSG